MIVHRKTPKKSERGIALVFALLVLLLLSTVLMGMIMMSNTETNVSANFRDEQTAFFASKAAVEEVRDRMRSTATNSLSTNLPTTALPGATNGIFYITNPASGETVTPWFPLGTNYPDTEICKEVTCASGVPTGSWYATPQSASTSYAATPILTWKWVRVMAKANKSATGTTRVTSVDGTTNGNRVCWTGTNEIATTMASCAAANSNYLPLYELTALAVTSGGSRRMTQYEVSRIPSPPMPGGVIFDGSTPDFSNNPNSNALLVSGTDAAQGPSAGVGCGAPANQPALGAYDTSSVTSLSGQVNRPVSYTSGSTPTPAVSNVYSALGPLTTVDGLTALVNLVTASAGANVFPNANSSTPTNLGTDSAPVVNVVQGDYTLSGSGTGILLVTGTLTMNGSPNFNGLILVIGKGNVQKNGGGNGILNGSLFVANLYSDTPPTYTNLIPLGSNHATGIPTIGWNGGGTANIQYDSCWISAVTQSFPYKVVAQRELIY
jgi:Na+-transporting methylmalonyl-CoA/oxaloacetate decarboxylase gamma subunit